MLRKLLTMTSRVGRPETTIDVGDSGGRILYLSAKLHPVNVVVPLERDQVRQLVAVCSSWLEERDGARPLSAQTQSGQWPGRGRVPAAPRLFGR